MLEECVQNNAMMCWKTCCERFARLHSWRHWHHVHSMLLLGVIRTFFLADNRSFVSGCLCVCMFPVSRSFLFTCLSVCRFAAPFYATCMRQKQLKSPYKYTRTQSNQTVLRLATFATYLVFDWRHSPCSV